MLLSYIIGGLEGFVNMDLRDFYKQLNIIRFP